ncbi:MAG: type VI secretion system baseplate subunit TssG [Pseudomonadota bacterium]
MYNISSYYQALELHPYRHDFFQTLRRIECLFPNKPRLGKALRPVDEPVRFAQEPSLAFAPSALASFQLPEGGRPARMEVRFFGLLGVNGPLPVHLTEYVRERMLHHGDKTLTRFLDMFHHRFIELFYRAWAQAQPTVNMDRPKEDRFAVYTGALFGLGGTQLTHRDAVEDFAKLHFAGVMSRQVRNPDGLAALLAGYFRIPVRIESFVGHWMKIPLCDRTCLGAQNDGAVLGVGTVLGAHVWDRQHKFRIWLGPLTQAEYESFLPGGKAIVRLLAWVRQYLCYELEWDVRLVLASGEVPKMCLGKQQRLGWNMWLGERRSGVDASDLTLDVERVAG